MINSAVPRAIVFAYHNVGARCLRVLRAHGVEVPLVVTHADDATEVQWFERVADVAENLGLAWIKPASVDHRDEMRRLAALAPDFVFSFYYRRMLPPAVLALPSRGALNMHGSLLPKYRGRAPVNWAVLNGERETGATLHYMIDKPDAGDIVAQQAVPILPDDTAREVSDKVTVAAEICLDAALPALLAGTATRHPNDVSKGSYFGGRRPEDGRIDWSRRAQEIHNLVRAVAPPFPGTFTNVAGVPARILRTRVLQAESRPAAPVLTVRELPSPLANGSPKPAEDALVALCGGGGTLRVDMLEMDGRLQTPATLRERFGAASLALG